MSCMKYLCDSIRMPVLSAALHDDDKCGNRHVKQPLYQPFCRRRMAHSSAYEENGSSRPVGKFWSLWFSSGERGS